MFPKLFTISYLLVCKCYAPSPVCSVGIHESDAALTCAQVKSSYTTDVYDEATCCANGVKSNMCDLNTVNVGKPRSVTRLEELVSLDTNRLNKTHFDAFVAFMGPNSVNSEGSMNRAAMPGAGPCKHPESVADTNGYYTDSGRYFYGSNDRFIARYENLKGQDYMPVGYGAMFWYEMFVDTLWFSGLTGCGAVKDSNGTVTGYAPTPLLHCILYGYAEMCPDATNNTCAFMSETRERGEISVAESEISVIISNISTALIWSLKNVEPETCEHDIIYPSAAIRPFNCAMSSTVHDKAVKLYSYLRDTFSVDELDGFWSFLMMFFELGTGYIDQDWTEAKAVGLAERRMMCDGVKTFTLLGAEDVQFTNLGTQGFLSGTSFLDYKEFVDNGLNDMRRYLCGNASALSVETNPSSLHTAENILSIGSSCNVISSS